MAVVEVAAGQLPGVCNAFMLVVAVVVEVGVWETPETPETPAQQGTPQLQTAYR